MYYTGVDVSNAAEVAVHLQSVAHIISSQPQLWYGKHKNFTVTRATYCAYNAFSRMDTRITAHIPGNVESIFVDSTGEQYSANENDQLWLETYMTSIVRCFLTYDDEEEDFTGQVVETRKIVPFQSKESVKYFFDGFKKLFFEGYKLGSKEFLLTTSNTNNYLTDVFLMVLELTKEFDYALQILEDLKKQDSSVLNLIVQVLLLKNEEVSAVKLMYEGVKANPRDGFLLNIQANYCLNKNALDFALSSAVKAVRSTPSEFQPWYTLVKIYIAKQDFENALLTLNSCPMVTHKEKFHLRRCTSTKNKQNMHLPLPVDVTIEDVSTLHANDVILDQQHVDPLLSNLPLSNLKTTFAKSYELLTEIVHKTGWEQLLKFRAKVFVMEDEYKKDHNSSNHLPLSKSDTNGTVQSLKSVPTNGDQVIEEFKKKRLCERWLDNLFMLLYEDLRQYTMWQLEQVHFEAQQLEYKKNSLEWELLGLVAFRLRHFKEAAMAFEMLLKARFSIRSSRKLLKFYQFEKNKLKNYEQQLLLGQQQQQIPKNITPEFIRKSIQDLNKKLIDDSVKLSVWNHRWYNEFSPMIVKALESVITDDGFDKVMNEIDGKYSDTPLKLKKQTEAVEPVKGVVELLNETFNFIKLFYNED